MGPERAACEVCKFDSSSGFDLTRALKLSLRPISSSHPTAGLQTDFLRMELLWVSAPGTGAGAAPAPGRALAAGGRPNQSTPAVGAWVSSPRSPRAQGPEQF